jgi:hypothetical protein
MLARAAGFRARPSIGLQQQQQQQQQQQCTSSRAKKTQKNSRAATFV